MAGMSNIQGIAKPDLLRLFVTITSGTSAVQDVREEQRAKRRRLLSAAASARIRRGMIRYLTV